jgi:hypothetical protein
VFSFSFQLFANSILVSTGLYIFSKEFSKEQEISTESIANALRLSKISTIATTLKRTASEKFNGRYSIDSGHSLRRQNGTHLFNNNIFDSDDDDRTVTSNPILNHKKHKIMRQEQVNRRSLIGRSSVVKHRARSVEKHSERFGQMKKTKEQIQKLKKLKLVKKRRKNKSRNQNQMVEMTNIITMPIEVASAAAVAAAAVEEKEEKEATITGNFYRIDKGTGESDGEEDPVIVNMNENEMFHHKRKESCK